MSAGRTLGNFVVEEEIGRGGMGVVLLARQPALDRPAVLKKVRADLLEFPELADRFEREARTAGAIHHQNVVAVYDRFRHRGSEYIAQEFVDGCDLAAVLEKTGALPWRIAGLIALEVAHGLEEIHAHGTVHRDLKPANILLGRQGEVKIGDFGLALDATGTALTQPGVAIGSPPYMAPEQLMGERIDARGDLFAFGVALYEMLCGERPYPEPEEGEECDGLLARMRRERYVPPRHRVRSVPRGLARMVRRCLRANPKRRPRSCRGLRVALESRLSRPSPADTRRELASWLWDHGVFERRDGETVVLVSSSPDAASSSRGWLAAIAATFVGSLLLVDAHPSSRSAEMPPEPTVVSSTRPETTTQPACAGDLSDHARYACEVARLPDSAALPDSSVSP